MKTRLWKRVKEAAKYRAHIGNFTKMNTMQNIGGEEKKEIDWGVELPKSEPIPTPELQKFIDMELFRMEAAKDAMCQLIGMGRDDGYKYSPEEVAHYAIVYADELIKQLKEKK